MSETKNASTGPSQPVLLGVVVVVALIGAGLAWATGIDGAKHWGVPVMWLCIGLAFVINWAAFVPAFIARTEHFYDLTGAITYTSVIVLAVATRTEPLDLRSGLLSALVLIWALRLGSFLFLRVRRAGKDSRFDERKHNFGRFLVAWTLQALWVSFTAAAALTAITSAPRADGGTAIDATLVIGALLWAGGFGIEVIADRQKTQWRKRRERGETAHPFITTGLWAYSRHPNYFGEIVLWFGVALIALPTLEGWRYVALASPVFVTLLLTKVSGVPLLEAQSDERFGDDDAYQAYKTRTNVVVLGPQRRS